MLKKLLFSLTLLLAATCSGATTHRHGSHLTLPAAAIQERVQDALVTLEWKDGADPRGWWLFCSGVAVGPHTVATNAHCINAAIQENERTYFNRMSCSSDKVVAFDGTDNVLIHTCQTYKYWVKMAQRMPQPRERVFEYGHPNGLPWLYREGYLSGIMHMDGTIPVVGGDLPEGWVWMFDMNTGHGDSGGPIFTMDGKLLCTVAFGVQRQGDSFDLTGCYAPWFTKQALAKID